jgi:hypothetical protein
MDLADLPKDLIMSSLLFSLEFNFEEFYIFLSIFDFLFIKILSN